MTLPSVQWARCPGDGRLHVLELTDLAAAVARGYNECLCGHRLPVEGLVIEDGPAGALCLPCMIGITAELPDPGRMGTAL